MRSVWAAVLFITASAVFIVNATVFYIFFDASAAGRNAQFARYYRSNILAQPEHRFCAASESLFLRAVIDCEMHKAALDTLMSWLEE